jgi:hypothetical protein
LRAAALDSTGRGMSVPDGLNAVSGLTALTAKRRDGHVRYLDTPSRRWLVYERDTHRDVGARAPRCLIFETHGAFRRAWDYPDNWYELSDEQLRALGAIDR